MPKDRPDRHFRKAGVAFPFSVERFRMPEYLNGGCGASLKNSAIFTAAELAIPSDSPGSGVKVRTYFQAFFEEV